MNASKVLCRLGIHRWRQRYRWREQTHLVEFLGLVGETHQWYVDERCTRCRAVLRGGWKDWREWFGHLCWIVPVAVFVVVLMALAPVAFLIALGGCVLFLMLVFGLLWVCV